MEHRQTEFAIAYNSPVVSACCGLLLGCKTWRIFNHNESPVTLAPLAWVRAPRCRSVAIATENLADSYSCGLGRFCCLRPASRRLDSFHCLAHSGRYP